MGRTRSPSRNRIELARERVVAAFASHWRSILRSDEDTAKERVDCFFAGSASAQKRLARHFYGSEHVQQMASLSTTEICETLGPWLEHALRYWLESYDDDNGDDFLDRLPTSEYVSIIHHHHQSGSSLIDRYPDDRADCDDLYERMISGHSIGGVLRIYKSTGERFTPSEARSVRAGIRRDLRSGMASAGDDDPWVIDMGADWSWGTEGFEDEDFERVVIAEVNDHADVS